MGGAPKSRVFGHMLYTFCGCFFALLPLRSATPNVQAAVGTLFDDIASSCRSLKSPLACQTLHRRQMQVFQMHSQPWQQAELASLQSGLAAAARRHCRFVFLLLQSLASPAMPAVSSAWLECSCVCLQKSLCMHDTSQQPLRLQHAPHKRQLGRAMHCILLLQPLARQPRQLLLTRAAAACAAPYAGQLGRTRTHAAQRPQVLPLAELNHSCKAGQGRARQGEARQEVVDSKLFKQTTCAGFHCQPLSGIALTRQ